jgi:hypothetical protein
VRCGNHRDGIAVGKITVERVQGDEETSPQSDGGKGETTDLRVLGFKKKYLMELLSEKGTA